MQAPVLVRRAAALGTRVCAALSFSAPLLTRITLGYTFFLTGRGKLANFDTFVQYMTDLGVPFPALNAAVVARLEYYGAILLVLGLFTRLASTALAGTMVVALFTAERQSFFNSWLPANPAGPTDIAPFVFLLFFGWLVLYGPGVVSLDVLLARWLREGETAPSAAPDPAAA